MVKAYAVNCNDAWLIPNDESKEGHYVKYEDYAALEAVVKALLADVKRRNPGHDLYCPFMRQLERLTK